MLHNNGRNKQFTRSRTSRAFPAMNEQKQTKPIDWKIRELMILIASVHDFNFFRSLLCLHPPRTGRNSIYQVGKLFRMKFTCHFSCCWCSQPSDANIYSVFRFPICEREIPRSAWNNFCVRKFVTYFHIFHWHAKQVVILFWNKDVQECQKGEGEGTSERIPIYWVEI